MFFEFESSSNQPTKDSSLAQNSIIMAKKISSISPLAIDSSNSFLNHHISPFSSSLSSSSTPTRHRRYSMHSFVSTTGQNQQQQSNALGTLRENIPASSNCDLALITKKKLMILTANGGSTSISTNSPFSLSSSSSSSSGILNGSLSNKLKSADEGFIEPDVKLNQTFTKRSNSDLRKEVLLASIQRSLSASSEDLFAINKTLNQESSSSSMNTDSLNDDDPMDQSMNTVSQSITIPMLIQNNQNNNSSSRYGSSSAIYMPSETQINQRSPTTFTSTLSMAGSIRNNHQSSPSCNYQSNNQNQQQQQQQQQSNNVSRLNDMMMMMGGGSGNLPYYSRGNSSMLSSSLSQSSPSSSMANICQTVQSSPSPMRTSLMKKRMYSTSPSKPYSPPLSMNNHHQQNNKDQSISSLSSPDWETAFKRLKVMHSANVDDSNNDHSHNHQHHNHHHHHPQQEQLNELAKDFHRLKTPFT